MAATCGPDRSTSAGRVASRDPGSLQRRRRRQRGRDVPSPRPAGRAVAGGTAHRAPCALAARRPRPGRPTCARTQQPGPAPGRAHDRWTRRRPRTRRVVRGGQRGHVREPLQGANLRGSPPARRPRPRAAPATPPARGGDPRMHVDRHRLGATLWNPAPPARAPSPPSAPRRSAAAGGWCGVAPSSPSTPRRAPRCPSRSG